MNQENGRRALKLRLAAGVVLLCLGFAVSMHSILTTADYHFVGFALTMLGASLVGSSLATWSRR